MGKGLSGLQMDILKWISRQDPPIYAWKDTVAWKGYCYGYANSWVFPLRTRSAISRALRRLEARGLVRTLNEIHGENFPIQLAKGKGPSRTRTTHVVLTEAGRKIVAALLNKP